MTTITSYAAEGIPTDTVAITNAAVTSDDNQTDYDNYFTAVISLIDSDTNEPFENSVDVRFMEYEADPSKYPDAEVIREIASWNISEMNPYVISDIPFISGHYYCVEVDELPDGYSFNGYSPSIQSGISGSGVLSGEQEYIIPVNHSAPTTELGFPLSIVRPSTFSIVDYQTKESIDGIRVTLVELDSDYNVISAIAEWNTSDISCYAVDLPYYWEDEHASTYYGLAVDALPENYPLNSVGTTDDGKEIVTVYRYGAYNYKIDMEFGHLDESNDYVLSLVAEGSDVHYTSTKVTEDDVITTTTTALTTDENNSNEDSVATTDTNTTESTDAVTTATAVTTSTTYIRTTPYADVYGFNTQATISAGEDITMSFNSALVSKVEFESDSPYITAELEDEIIQSYDNQFTIHCSEDSVSGKATLTIIFTHTMTGEIGEHTIELTILSSEQQTETTTATETSTDTTTTSVVDNSGDETLPQTGYSNIYNLIIGLAALMTLTGTAIVIKTRKVDE